ncbi:Spo0B domain-containing protein [Planococcus lenghuensis]|uniref:SpoOB alpha-helical domain-containing protein n=1 Tax=Planococcus lenghuensis TaxID=2213202 RepID=A0A1Q2KXM6_9BACL|nr:Spo0B domain-containing protein [Planococcus lenghuensis]AQQ52903.1 hypothetical protein B0X71_07240 [Planococcus lenghuensis]
MKDKLTVAEALQHARHDFLNKLQLIKINADLGKTDRISGLIEEFAELAKVQSCLVRLGLPVTEEWLLTAGWRFPEFLVNVECSGDRAPQELDQQFTDFLEALLIGITETCDMETETVCTVRLGAEQSLFKITVLLNGHLPALPSYPEDVLTVEQQQAEQDTIITVTAKLEG